MANQLPVRVGQQQLLDRIVVMGGFEHQIGAGLGDGMQDIAVQSLAPYGAGVDRDATLA